MKTDFTRTRKYVYWWASDKSRKLVADNSEPLLRLKLHAHIDNAIEFQINGFVFNHISASCVDEN